MRIAGVYSFNGGVEYVQQHFKAELEEVVHARKRCPEKCFIARWD